MLKSYYPPSVLKYPYISEKMPEEFEEQIEKEFIPCDFISINYMREHLRAVSRAISTGVPVKGYFYWTIMDMSEHVCGGYTLKFGLVQVNFETKKRIPRKSWYYYQGLIKDGFAD